MNDGQADCLNRPELSASPGMYRSVFVIGPWLIAAVAMAGETIPLFNGKDLSGWHLDTPMREGVSASTDFVVKDGVLTFDTRKGEWWEASPPSFIVRDGLLVSLGNPPGHLITDAAFSDYRLVVEYRFPKKPGNCGVLVHASTPRALYNMFPASIEVQMMHENAGDFWCIAENIEVPDMEARRPREDETQAFGGTEGDARRILNLVDGAERPLGDWNTLVITCLGDTIEVHVNGILVNWGFHSTATRGRIALQAEGAEVEFRKVDLTRLSGDS
jgi:hypothetical protein